MLSKMRPTIALVVFLAAAGTAQAQTYGQQPPLYPYAAQQSYAVEVAPNTYVIQRPATTRDYPYITCVNCSRNARAVLPVPSAPAVDRPHRPADRGLIEQLRTRNEAKQIEPQPAKPAVITTKKVVREKPIVHETVRLVDDPPRVIERRHVVVDAPPPPRRHAPAAVKDGNGQASGADGNVAPAADGKVRVIRAEAEVTILGPDRMSIRLFRRRGEPEAKALSGE